jgi:hypothetical protein
MLEAGWQRCPYCPPPRPRPERIEEELATDRKAAGAGLGLLGGLVGMAAGAAFMLNVEKLPSGLDWVVILGGMAFVAALVVAALANRPGTRTAATTVASGLLGVAGGVALGIVLLILTLVAAVIQFLSSCCGTLK